MLSTLNAPSALADNGPLTTDQRQRRAFTIRRDAAQLQRDRAQQPSVSNGDELLYPNRIATFTKGLPHSDLGEVDLTAYSAFTKALNSGLASDFEAIPLGGTTKLANPEAAYCYSLEGADAEAISVPPAPAFASAQMAAEIAESYWFALTRDVPFSQYATDPTITQATADLSKLSDYRGTKANGQVTTDVIFRGNTPGDLAGPYISQFLWKTVPMGGGNFTQQYRTSVAGNDYMTNYADWIKVLRGSSNGTNVFDSAPRYIRNNRDLTQFLFVDFMGQANVNALFLLLSYGAPALSPSNPYLSLTKTASGITFGPQGIPDLVLRTPISALRASFYQKWLVHLRVRPETFAGQIHNNVTGATNYPIHGDILNSAALKSVFTAHGTYLLPMPYPAGCPLRFPLPIRPRTVWLQGRDSPCSRRCSMSPL